MTPEGTAGMTPEGAAARNESGRRPVRPREVPGMTPAALPERLRGNENEERTP